MPGTDVSLVQKKPAVVLSAGETSIAIEHEMARKIWVRPGEAKQKEEKARRSLEERSLETGQYDPIIYLLP